MKLNINSKNKMKTTTTEIKKKTIAQYMNIAYPLNYDTSMDALLPVIAKIEHDANINVIMYRTSTFIEKGWGQDGIDSYEADENIPIDDRRLNAVFNFCYIMAKQLLITYEPKQEETINDYR